MSDTFAWVVTPEFQGYHKLVTGDVQGSGCSPSTGESPSPESSPVEGEDYEAEEIATGFALATTSSDCRLQRITPPPAKELVRRAGLTPLIPSASSGQALRGELGNAK